MACFLYTEILTECSMSADTATVRPTEPRKFAGGLFAKLSAIFFEPESFQVNRKPTWPESFLVWRSS